MAKTATLTTTTTTAASSGKKRKHTTIENSPSSSKTPASSSSTKKRKKSDHDRSKDKVSKLAGSVSAISLQSNNVDDKPSGDEFRRIQAQMTVSIPPVFIATPIRGIQEMLDSLVFRYIPSFEGVVLGHSNLRLSSSKASIQWDCPFATCHITFDALIWSPRIGMRLSAQVKVASTDHIGLLAHDVFNVSIPRHHIPLSEWVFQHGPAENDPEFGAGTSSLYASGKPEGDSMDLDETSALRGKGKEKEKEIDAVGTWVSAKTSKPIGGKTGRVTFTVVGLMPTSGTLTLLGSLQPDPFSSAHVPEKSLAPQARIFVEESSDDEVLTYGVSNANSKPNKKLRFDGVQERGEPSIHNVQPSTALSLGESDSEEDDLPPPSTLIPGASAIQPYQALPPLASAPVTEDIDTEDEIQEDEDEETIARRKKREKKEKKEKKEHKSKRTPEEQEYHKAKKAKKAAKAAVKAAKEATS